MIYSRSGVLNPKEHPTERAGGTAGETGREGWAVEQEAAPLGLVRVAARGLTASLGRGQQDVRGGGIETDGGGRVLGLTWEG